MRAASALAVSLVVGASGFACERSPTAVPNQPTPTLSANLSKTGGGLLSCKPLGYDSATAVIGPAGGVLKFSKHFLVVPAGALSAPVRITAVVPSDTVNRVQLQPEGLTFSVPAQLTMSYGNCKVPPSAAQIAYTTAALAIVEYVPSTDAATAKLVTGRLSHFSNYAVAW